LERRSAILVVIDGKSVIEWGINYLVYSKEWKRPSQHFDDRSTRIAVIVVNPKRAHDREIVNAKSHMTWATIDIVNPKRHMTRYHRPEEGT